MASRSMMLWLALTATLVAALWEWAWRPLAANRDALRAQVESATALHRWAEVTIPRVIGSTGADNASVPLAEASRLIQQTVQRFGFGSAVTRIEPRDDRILVSLEAAPFDHLAGWLATLKDEAGLHVAAAELSRAPESGKVSGRLELRGSTP